MRINTPRSVFAAFLAVLLSGCASAPSDAEMQEALLGVMRPVTGPSTAIESFEVRNCESFKNGVYRCRVKAVMTYTFELGGRRQEKTQPFVGLYDFIKTADGGWKLVN